jgi:alpha-ribazole phosphatase
MNPATLYLVRHGAIIRVAGQAYIGQIEAPLSEEGVEHAWALRKWLEPIHFSHVYSSDLSRSQRTAKIIAGPRIRSVETLPSLREISLGEWEGFTFKEIEQRFPEEFAARGRDMENWRPPGGESFADCRARVMSQLRTILDGAQGNILLVGHAGVNRLILCEVLGIPVAKLHSIGQDYGCINTIEYSDARTRVQLLNFVPRRTRPVEQIAEAQVKRTARGREGISA